MTTLLLGTSVTPGVALGSVHPVETDGGTTVRRTLHGNTEVEEETRRLEDAVEAALAELEEIHNRFLGTSEELAAFIDTHLLMLQDSNMVREPLRLIRETRCNAEWALTQHRDELLRQFDAMGDPYLRGRRDDVEQICDRIQRILARQPPPHHEHPSANPLAGCVVLGHRLGAADTILLHRQGAAALLSERGGSTSHGAILARNLNLPMIIGLDRARHYLQAGETVIVDAAAGIVLAGPDTALLRHYHRAQRRAARQERRLRLAHPAPAMTRDGVKVRMRANISRPEEVEPARRAGADGIGLYRTEWLYMNREQPPGEDEHYRTYKQLLEKLHGRILTVRLADLESHQLTRSRSTAGNNPAMGMRSLRIGLSEPEIIMPQLRAVLRAAALGPLRLLLPMVTSIQELERFLELHRFAVEELEQSGQLHEQKPPIGIMIEVPAAAVCADLFAKRLDFLAIGSNDLTQYTLAADRNDGELFHVYEPLHPALLRLIRDVQKAADEARIPAYLCGELAGEPECLPLLLGLGLRELSLSPVKLPVMHRALADLHLDQACALAEQALRQETAGAVSALLRKTAAS